MIRDIIKYPQTPSIEFNAPVRSFNNELFELIQDLKDTIESNDLKALSAFQINNPYSVIVIKQEDGTFLELINARILKSSDKITTKEKTLYFGDIEVPVTRDKHITVMYENADAKQCYLDASDEQAVLLQRKIDYTFGATFRQRLDDAGVDELDMKLEHGSDVIINNSCPTVFHRDKILKVINVMLALTLIVVLSKLFISEDSVDSINNLLDYSFLTILTLVIIYPIYAYYEGKKYTNCMSCQIGNIIGVGLFHLFKLGVVYIISIFI